MLFKMYSKVSYQGRIYIIRGKTYSGMTEIVYDIDAEFGFYVRGCDLSPAIPRNVLSEFMYPDYIVTSCGEYLYEDKK